MALGRIELLTSALFYQIPIFLSNIFMRAKVFKLIILFYFMALKLNRNFALLYGVMLGDGCLSLVYGRKKFVAISGSMADDIPFFEKVVKPIIKGLVSKEIPIKFRNKKNTIDLNFVNHSLFDYIARFGFPIGKKGNKLFIPKIFYGKNLVKYAIKGFFATDGSLVLTNNNGTLYPRIEANGISESLIKEISNYLNNKGINCNFYEAKRKDHRWKTWQQQYRLQINGKDNLRKFVKTIGFINPKQIEKLKYYYGCTETRTRGPGLMRAVLCH